MPKLTKNHDSVRFNPAARFEAKPASHAMQALSIVCQQFKPEMEDSPKLTLLESFKIYAVLLKVHMTRALGQEHGVMIFQSDIPSLSFAQPLYPAQLTSTMIMIMQSKGYTLHVPPSSDTDLAFVSWGPDILGSQGWTVHQRTRGLEPLFIDAELQPTQDEDRPPTLERLQISAP